jgi:hypothetical protein
VAISLSPGYDAAGGYSAHALAGSGAADYVPFHIEVLNVDRPPTFVVPDTVQVEVGDDTSIGIHIADPDGDQIAWSALLPTFAAISGPTQGTGGIASSIVFTPGEGDLGAYGIDLTATSGGLTTSSRIDLLVMTHTIPVGLLVPGRISADEGSAIDLSVRVCQSEPSRGMYPAHGKLAARGYVPRHG